MPHAYGGYYAWGETYEKNNYSWDTYRYGSSNLNVENIGADIAGTHYDVATFSWGSFWCMPNITQFMELQQNTTSTWTVENGKYGRKFLGANGGSIFLPAAGFRSAGGTYDKESRGNYWSSNVSSVAYKARIFTFYDRYAYDSSEYRMRGYSIRPVHSN